MIRRHRENLQDLLMIWLWRVKGRRKKERPHRVRARRAVGILCAVRNLLGLGSLWDIQAELSRGQSTTEI